MLLRFAFEHKIQSLNYANGPQLRQSVAGARYVYAMLDGWGLYVWFCVCVRIPKEVAEFIDYDFTAIPLRLPGFLAQMQNKRTKIAHTLTAGGGRRIPEAFATETTNSGLAVLVFFLAKRKNISHLAVTFWATEQFLFRRRDKRNQLQSYIWLWKWFSFGLMAKRFSFPTLSSMIRLSLISFSIHPNPNLHPAILKATKQQKPLAFGHPLAPETTTFGSPGYSAACHFGHRSRTLS